MMAEREPAREDFGGARALTSTQRARLRSLAHHLDPLVHAGKKGVTEAVVAEVDRALLAHELIKVRLAGGREERRVAALDLAERTSAALAGTIGRVAILYRVHPDPEKRSIQLD
jgi:RNA-binding protein